MGLREDGVRVFDFVHVGKAWGMVKEGRVCVALDLLVYLDGSTASVFPCI